MNLHLKSPSDKEFMLIQAYILEFELDSRALQKEQFTAAYRDNELVGFGRIRKHDDCIELCSLGVITQHRRKGIGKAIVKELVHRAEQSIYLVCIIPEFFTPLNFRIVSEFPDSINKKINYCKEELIVPESYVAMLFQK
jgi:N-acetylglutamate synthase-like GNAT family acetyltransferase